MSETSSLSGSLTKSTSSGKMRDLRAATYFDSLPPHLLNTIMKYMTVALAVFDWDMRYVAVSDRWLRDFEILDRNVIGKSHYDVLKVPEGRKIIHQRALAGEVLSGEMDFVVDDEKRKIWLSWMVRPWYDANGEIGGVIIITEFVTEKVRLEQELHYRETIYRTLARNYPNSGVFVFDHDLRYVLAEGESLKQQGFADNYFEGNTFYEVSTPQTIEHLESYFLDTLAGNRHHLEFLRRTGKYFDLHFVPLRDADDDVVAGMLVSRDMTEQYEARKLLEDSEKRFRSIVNDQTDLICLFNADGDIEFANSAFCDYFDVTAEQPSQTNFLVMTAQNASDEQTSLQQITPANPILETARAVPQTNLTNPPNWIHWTIRGIFDDEGNLERFQAVGHDITLRKRFGKAQKKQKAWESTLKEISSALNSTLNLDQVLERIIDNIERIVPYDAANVMLIEDGTARVVRERGYTRFNSLDEVLSLRLPIDDTPHLSRMVERGEHLVLSDLTHRRDRWLKHRALHWVKSYAGTPIWLQERIIGFLSVESTVPGYYKKKHARRLRTFADNTATAIRNAQLYEQAQQAGMWEERQRIARELHDAVSQALFAANMIADSLPLMLDKKREDLPDHLQTLRQYTHLAFTEMRTMLFELRPQAIEDARLTELVQQLVHSFQSRTEIQIGLHIDADATVKIPTPTKLAFYRISQEAINNIIHHSGASTSTISLSITVDGITLIVTDNGRGFEVDDAHPGHMGLQIMRDRAVGIGAILVIESRPGEGAHITARWSTES